MKREVRKDNKIKIKTNGVFTKMYIDGIEIKHIESLKFEHKSPEELASIEVKLLPLYCEIESLDFEKI